MPQPWRLSPSDLTFLWSECPRCFYLKVVRGFARPSMPMPKIFTTIDLLMKRFFQDAATHDLSPLLPAGTVSLGDRWVTSETIRRPGGDCYIKGKFDSVVRFEDGSYGVVDFKTSAPKPAHIPFYGRQLHAYAYALEHPAPRALSLAPVSALGLFVVEPNAMQRHSESTLAYLGGVTWLGCARDEPAFLSFLDGVLELLALPDPPPPGEECAFCRYRDSARQTGW